MNKKTILIIIIAIIVLSVGYYLISPLWRDKTLNDESPLTTQSQLDKEVAEMADQTKSMEDAMPANTPAIIAQGQMQKAKYDVEGRAVVIDASKNTILRFEDFKTTNGPDLKIYLSKDLEATDYVDLGSLKATEGNINYDVPAGTNISQYKYALVWCRAFKTLFSYAELR